MLTELLSTISIVISKFEYCDTYHWIYYQQEKKIEVCKTWNKEQMKFTLIHELWHYFRYEYMTDEERFNYNSLFVNSKETDFYREYSTTSITEDFADMFALAYIEDINWNKSRVFNLKKEYINFLIKKKNGNK